mgnify:FL=1
MARVRLVQTSFVRGELDPFMAGRVDLDSYFNGASVCRNWLLLDQGGLMRRPGTEYKATLPGTARLVPFTFSQDERYLFAFSNTRLDVYSMAGAAIANITSCPWTTSQLQGLDFAQYGDTMFLVHQGMPIQKIVRTGATTFARSAFAFETHSSGYPIYEPYFKFADEATTITPSGTTGSITLTLSAAHWVSAHVGAHVRVAGKTCTVTGFTNTTVVNASVNETLAGTGATSSWDEGVFSAAQGYPGCVELHEQRLWLAGSIGYPSFISASNSTAFQKFDVGTGLDDESIQHAIGSDGINEIRYIVSSRHLQIFTDIGEFYPPLTSNAALTPANMSFRRQTRYGAKRVAPQDLDGATLFLQSTGNAVREFLYEDVAQAYTAEAISIMSPHLLNAPVESASQRGNDTRPEQNAFFLNTDGTVAVFHTARGQDIAGWTLWSTRTGDEFVSIQAVGSELFAAVRRSINGSNVFYLEKFSDDDSVTLDSQKTISGSGATFTGLAHLAGESVYLIANGVSLGAHTVTGAGAVTITETGVTSLKAGFNYPPTLTTMPADASTRSGPRTGDVRRILRASLVLNTALSVAVQGQEMIVRQVTDDLSLPPVAITDSKDFYFRGYSRNPTVTITQTDPLSLRILALALELVY